MVICLERGAELHMTQLMPLPLTVSCFSKIQTGLPFWYWLTWVVPDKGPLNGCVRMCNCSIFMCLRLYCMGSTKMDALNKHLMEFVSSHISKDPSCNLMPVFDDYRSRIVDISAECSNQVETQSGTQETAAAASLASASTGEQ